MEETLPLDVVFLVDLSRGGNTSLQILCSSSETRRGAGVRQFKQLPGLPLGL